MQWVGSFHMYCLSAHPRFARLTVNRIKIPNICCKSVCVRSSLSVRLFIVRKTMSRFWFLPSLLGCCCQKEQCCFKLLNLNLLPLPQVQQTSDYNHTACWCSINSKITFMKSLMHQSLALQRETNGNYPMLATRLEFANLWN